MKLSISVPDEHAEVVRMMADEHRTSVSAVFVMAIECYATQREYRYERPRIGRWVKRHYSKGQPLET